MFVKQKGISVTNKPLQFDKTSYLLVALLFITLPYVVLLMINYPFIEPVSMVKNVGMLINDNIKNYLQILVHGDTKKEVEMTTWGKYTKWGKDCLDVISSLFNFKNLFHVLTNQSNNNIVMDIFDIFQKLNQIPTDERWNECLEKLITKKYPDATPRQIGIFKDMAHYLHGYIDNLGAEIDKLEEDNVKCRRAHVNEINNVIHEMGVRYARLITQEGIDAQKRAFNCMIETMYSTNTIDEYSKQALLRYIANTYIDLAGVNTNINTNIGSTTETNTDIVSTGHTNNTNNTNAGTASSTQNSSTNNNSV